MATIQFTITAITIAAAAATVRVVVVVVDVCHTIVIDSVKHLTTEYISFLTNIGRSYI